MVTVINSFRDEYSFLSNFYPSPVNYRGIMFPTAEHAFAAGKTNDTNAIQRIAAASTPAEAKALGRSVSLIPDWDSIKFSVMWDVLWSKFTGNVVPSQKLIATRGALLVEGNSWHDQVWGDCTCRKHAEIPGDNALGVMLMALRLHIGIQQPPLHNS